MTNIKLIGLSVIGFIIAINLAACSSSEDEKAKDNPTEMPEEVTPTITLDANNESILSNGMNFSSDTNESTLTFTTNVDWSISVPNMRGGDSWYTVTPMSGKAGTNTIKVKVTANTGFDDRNTILTLEAKTLAKTIKVNQKQKNALTLTTNKIELDKAGGIINVEVKANVTYDVVISESCKNWISLESKARALTTNNISFRVAKSEEYDKREGIVTIKSGDLSETVKVLQSGEAILLLTKDNYSVGSNGETITVELKSNFDYKVGMPSVDWIKEETKTRGISSHTIRYVVSSNNTYDKREAEIQFFDRNNSNTTVKVKVVQNGLILTGKWRIDSSDTNGKVEVWDGYPYYIVSDTHFYFTDTAGNTKSDNCTYTFDKENKILKGKYVNSGKSYDMIVSKHTATQADFKWDEEGDGRKMVTIHCTKVP